MGQEEYQELSSFLDRFIRRLSFLQGIEGLCLLGICALVLFSLGPGIQRITDFFPYAPVVYSLLTGAVLLFLIARTLFRVIRRWSQERAALYIEKKQPKLRNNLINSLQLYPEVERKSSEGVSASMILALLRTTRRQLSLLKLEDLIDSRRIKADLRLLAVLFVPVVAMVLFNPSWVGETFSLLTNPLKHMPPSRTFIDVMPKNLRVVRGSPVTVLATTSGALPKSMELILWTGQTEKPGARDGERLLMEDLGGGKFTATLPHLQKTLRYRVATGPFSSPSYTMEAVDPPEIGNIRLTVYPPHYSGLAAQTVEGGNVEGLKGSTIRFAASTTKEVVKAEILTDDGKKIPLKFEGNTLQGNLVLFQPQQYRIAVEDALGFRNSPIAYELRVRPDGFPTIDLLQPTEDLEINGDEVLPLEFSARDDFGVQEIHLAVKIGGREEKIRIEREGAKKLILRERYNWDLGKLGLREGDEAIFHFEALDNDTISGPKLGTSKALRLRLKNLKAEHRQVADMIRDLSNRMIDHLADHLESPLPGDKEPLNQGEAETRFEQNLAETMKRIEEVMQRTEKDRLTDFATWSDLEALKRNLKYTKDDLLAQKEQAATAEEKGKVNDEISSELERMSLLSEEIGKRLQAQELASTAQDVMKSQERLMESLDKLQSGDKNLDAIMKQISDLAKLLGSLQQSLSQFASRMPDEFMNNEAMRGLGFNDMLSALEQIRKKLLEGDIEGAKQLARELFNQLASMIASLQNAQRSAMSSTMGRMQGEMMRSASELEQILREQQEILVGTEGINKSALSERDAALKEKLDQFQAKAMEELSRLAELFPDREGGESGDEGGAQDQPFDEATMNQLLKNLISKLLSKDFPGYAEGHEMAKNELAKKRSAEQEPKARRTETSLKELKTDLDALLAEPSRELTDAEKKSLRDLSRREAILRERTQELHQKLDTLFQLFPSLDPKITKNIEAAGTAMSTAKDRLGDLDGKGAVPPEREALERLSQSQQQMQTSMQQLAQRGQLGRMPVTYLFRRGRFLPSGMLVPLPGMPDFPQFDVEGGMTGLDMEKFRLPGKEDYKAPRSFREEILESLKQGVPPQHKDQIERYFKNLSE